MSTFAARIAALPRNNSGSIEWVSMSKGDIADAATAAVAEGDKRLYRLASAALERAFLHEIKAGKHAPKWANDAPYFGPMTDDEGNA